MGLNPKPCYELGPSRVSIQLPLGHRWVSIQLQLGHSRISIQLQLGHQESQECPVRYCLVTQMVGHLQLQLFLLLFSLCDMYCSLSTCWSCKPCVDITTAGCCRCLDWLNMFGMKVEDGYP